MTMSVSLERYLSLNSVVSRWQQNKAAKPNANFSNRSVKGSSSNSSSSSMEDSGQQQQQQQRRQQQAANKRSGWSSHINWERLKPSEYCTTYLQYLLRTYERPICTSFAQDSFKTHMVVHMKERFTLLKRPESKHVFPN